MCKFEFVRPTAASNINMPTAIPIKPMACIRIRPNPGNHQDPKQKTNQQKQIDKCATLCEGKIARDHSAG
jgi:hypothetical protein